MPSRRQLTTQVRQALAMDNRADALAALVAIAPKTRLGPLYSMLLDKDALVRWRAVTVFGAAMVELAATHPEDARDVWRNLMWRLNEESGNIAWGIPECMGEVLAVCPALAVANHRILLSYVQEQEGDCTYIDHAPLRRGAWWAVARLAEVAPQLVAPALPEIIKALDDPDAEARGLACLAVGRIKPEPSRTLLEALSRLTGDANAFDFYAGWPVVATSVAEQATIALDRCRQCL